MNKHQRQLIKDLQDQQKKITVVYNIKTCQDCNEVSAESHGYCGHCGSENVIWSTTEQVVNR